MAANWKIGHGIAASLGKRVADQIWTSSPSSLLRRAAHTSVWDKNLDDHVRPAIVPDHMIQPQSDKYWAPHPQTGVFGPITDHVPTAGDASAPPAVDGETLVVEEEKAWFRPSSLEDLEKPHHV